MGIDQPKGKKIDKKISTKKSPKGNPQPGTKETKETIDEKRKEQRNLVLGALGSAGFIAFLALAPKPETTETVKPNRSEQKQLPRSNEQTPRTSRLRPGKIDPIKLAPPRNQEEYMEGQFKLQDHWKKISEEALGAFEAADPRVAVLHDMMKKNAFYTTPVGQVTTVRAIRGSQSEILNAKPNPQEFEIVYMPEQFARHMASAILTEAGGKTVRIATTFKSKEWLGIMLAHELSHVEDQLYHGENSRNHEEYMAGEVRAHKFEMGLLRSWNPKVYEELLSKGIPLYEKKQYDELDALVASLYPVTTPEVSPNEKALGTASAFLAVAFEGAIKKGATDKDLQAVYAQLVREFGKK